MHETQTLKFWKGRITGRPQDGPGHPDLGWKVVNKAHKKIVRRHIEPGDRVLDAGCGVGRIANWFKNYTGIDFIQEFIEKAIELHPGKIFYTIDFNKKIPLRSGYFDWVVMVSASQYIKNKKELKRVAKNILCLGYGTPEDYEIL